MNSKITKYAFLNAIATTAYIIVISYFLYLAEKGIFKTTKTILIPIAMLMLFVFSAALTGFLIFGRPAMWYLNGKKSKALLLLAQTLIIFLILTILAFFMLSLLK